MCNGADDHRACGSGILVGMDTLTPHYKIPESVLVVIYTPELDVLLLERADHPGFWQSVTGSKDAEDEPLAATAMREVREETGIIVERRAVGDGPCTVPLSALLDWRCSIRYEIYPQWRHRYAPGVARNTEHWFSLCVPRDIPVILNPREHLQAMWVPWAQAAAQCFSPSNGDAIRQLPERVKP